MDDIKNIEKNILILDYGFEYHDTNIYFDIEDKCFYDGCGTELTPYEVFNLCIEAERLDNGYIQYDNMKYLLDDCLRWANVSN